MTGAATILRRAAGGVLRRRRDLAVWAAILLAQSLAMIPFRDQLLALQQGTIPSTIDGEIDTATLGAAAFVILLSSIATLMLGVATMRAAVEDRADRFAHLRLGLDELRLIGAAFIQTLVFYAMILGLVLLFALFAGVLSIVAGPLAALLAVPAMLVAIILPIYVWFRLSLLFPLTLLRHCISLRESWRLTRGRVGTLFGIFLAFMLLGLLLLVPLLFFGGVSLGGSEAEVLASLAAMGEQSLAAQLVTMVVGTLLMTPLYALAGATFAEAAMALAADREAVGAVAATTPTVRKGPWG